MSQMRHASQLLSSYCLCLLNAYGLRRLQINLQCDPLAHCHLPGLDNRTPTQIEVLAVDLRFRRQASALHSHHKTLTTVLGIKANSFGHAMHGEIAAHLVLLIGNMLNMRAFESNEGIFLNIKEIG